MIVISSSELDRLIESLSSAMLRAEEGAVHSHPSDVYAYCAGYLEAEIEQALRTLVAIRTDNASLKEAA